MTPEELNRTIEFIIQSQSRLAAAQEQDRHDRIQFEEWSKGLFARMEQTEARMEQTEARLALLFNRQTRLLDHQSQRMDRLDKFYEDWLRQNEDFQKQALHAQSDSR